MSTQDERSAVEAIDHSQPDLAAFEAADSGGRKATGVAGTIVVVTAFIWSLFQLYISSSVPYWVTENFGFNAVFNSSESRVIHLAFAMALTMLSYPLFKNSPKDRVPVYDWVLAAIGASTCFYLIFFKLDIATRAGLPTTADLIMSAVGLIALAIAVYRALGMPMLIVAGVFVFYVFFGHLSWMPEAVQWKGASFGKAMWHYWMQGEGVFGVALSVSASMIFLFVLFGALLERAGAGNYFIKLDFGL
jgi:TRAP-type uncharacterized transport system fused permease subunit